MTMPFAEHLIGNTMLPALHGGTLATLLESAAMFELMCQSSSPATPQIINITTNYLQMLCTMV